MPVSITRGKTDRILEQIKDCLESYQKNHPDAEISLYRQNSVSIRIRIIDPRFAGMSRADRSDIRRGNTSRASPTRPRATSACSSY